MMINLGETEMWVGFENRFGNAIYYSVLVSFFTCSFESFVCQAVGASARAVRKLNDFLC